LTLEAFLRYEIFGLIAVILLVVIYQMLTGRININKLLTDKKTGQTSSSRIQQLFFTAFIAMYYVYLSYKDPSRFPELPPEILYLMGGSSALYLSDKARSLLKLFTKKTG
jgi:hypothetical protein